MNVLGTPEPSISKQYELNLRRIYVCTKPWKQQLPDFNTLRPRQNGRHFPDDIFKCIFLDENV